jgi:class 3 adenylate cyclase
MMVDLPRGTLTFLFTDIEGSSALWERDRVATAAAGDDGAIGARWLIFARSEKTIERRAVPLLVAARR